MAIRVPSGRAGRPWLARRLEIARRGADVLDEKRRALLRLERQLDELAASTSAEWKEAADEAETWARRARFVGGEGAFELACFYSRAEPRVDIRWRKTLGVVYPADADVELPEPPDVSALGGGAALVFAAAAHRRALEAAVRHAAASFALRRVHAELQATARRLRAVEQRWIPRYEGALAALELELDEGEREQATRLRWAVRRGAVRR
jgi:V/A-type H+-transporting ATPase subunit D